MSTADTTSTPSPLPFVPGPRLLTAADLAALPEDLPSGRAFYELDRGRLAIMSPPGYRHGRIQSTLVAYLKDRGEWRGLGHAYTDIGVVVSRNPDTIYSPDVAFISAERLPVRESKEGYCETIPDFVAEVRSKNDSLPELARKVQAYLAAGVQTVWIVDPIANTVTVEEPGVPPQSFAAGQTLPPPRALADLQLGVDQLFD